MAEENEENIVRVSVTYDTTPQEWEDDIVDAYRDHPRKSIWIPLAHQTGNWYITRERGIHNLVNAALREYMEAATAPQKAEVRTEPE